MCSIIVYFLSRWNSEKLFLQVLDDGWIANDLALRQEQVERNALVGDHKAFQFVHAGLAHGVPPGDRPERPLAERQQPEAGGSEQKPEATQPPPKEPPAPPPQPGA